jgi:integrase
MARARTAPGTHGDVTVIRQLRQPQGWRKAPAGAPRLVGRKAEGVQRYRASGLYRDRDGKVHQVARFEATEAAARMAVRTALATFEATTTGGVLRSDTTVKAAGQLWLEQAQRNGLSGNTMSQYRGTFTRIIVDSELAVRTLREANTVPVLRAFLQKVADERGAGSAKTARSVLSSIIRLAVEDGVLPHNAVRDIRPVRPLSPREASERDTDRAFTRAERDRLLEVADGHERARLLDVSDIAWWMAGTGCRISEALGQRWEDVDLGADPPTALVRGTKSRAAQRKLSLPPRLVERLRRRAESRGTTGLVFPSPGTGDADKVRDGRNVARILRQVLDSACLPWATPHTLRRTAITLLSEQGVPIVAIADLAGHSDPGMTMRVYLGRDRDNVTAGALAL